MSRAGSLRGYILIRIALMVPMVWVLLTVVFLMMRVAPGDPITATLGGKLTPEELAERQAALGFDRPLIVQYFEYLWDAVRLQFGTTITDGQTIGSLLVENGGATLTLTVAALIFALVVGLPLGLIAGRYRETVPDAFIRIFAILGYAAPPFFVGLLALLLFAQNLDWFPASKMASPIVQATSVTHTHILIVDLAIEGDWAGVWDVLDAPRAPGGDPRPAGHGRLHPPRARQRRAGARQRLRRGCSRSRHPGAARGLEARVPQHIVPVVTVMGLQVALLLGGAVLTEQTFSWPGLGSRLLQYLTNRDYIGVQGLITFFALVVVVISLFIDIINALIDPRVRY